MGVVTASGLAAIALEAAAGVLLALYAAVLATAPSDRSRAGLFLSALCAVVALMLGANLAQQIAHWPRLGDLVLFLDLMAPALVLQLVRQARSPPPRLSALDLLHLAPALAGLALWESGRAPAMDAYVIGVWSLYLAAAVRGFLVGRNAYGSAATWRLLAGVLIAAGLVLGLRLVIVAQASASGSFLGAPGYLAVLAVSLAAACLALFWALRRALRRAPLIAAYAAEGEPDFDSLDARLAAVMAGQPFLDPALGLDGLARALGAAPRQVSRLINERHGGNVAAFLNRHRVEAAAARLLAEPGAPIKTVMYDAGFTSKSLFNAEFQRRLGMSPSAYRQRRAGETPAKPPTRPPSSGSRTIRRA
ncbi:helix-turn-helix domain-containing protein [Phenylobacterium sp.]|uniref:AraC family transcriptional regulator n=1 Tax=Phenylobacterium sp. TaxID=1871053 RepID=UPI002CC959EC|nr:helix-turn-helix domain-containing protein [Phenylobacterium sp.]HLZ76318.1 helix-turn-helix domain-containing protein [Phenylobacterium sp.]